MSAAGRGRVWGGRGARWRAGCSCTVGTKLAHQYTILVLSSAQWKIVNRCKQLIMNNLTSVHVCVMYWQHLAGVQTLYDMSCAGA